MSNVKSGTPPSSTSSLTDEELGQAFDWGFPLIPTSELKEQVHVSVGDVCREANCQGQPSTSCLWITPDADADIVIDRRHIGSGYDIVEAKELESVELQMEELSGAIVFATEKGSGVGGFGVNIAGAWGRNPAVPNENHSRGGPSFKGGVTLLPYDVFGKSTKKGPGTVKAGEQIDYEIVIENLGPLEYGPGEFNILDELPFGLTYIEGSLEYSSTAGSTWETLDNDLTGNSIYQLDEGGLPGPYLLPAHGGVHMIRYSTLTEDPINDLVEYNNEVDGKFRSTSSPRRIVLTNRYLQCRSLTTKNHWSWTKKQK